MVDQTLLPPNAVPWERAVSATFVRIQAIPVPIRQVKSPADCPVPLLPWLAVERGVREWDPTWPEAQKRATIAGSYELKAHNATRWAVVRAINLLGMNVQYQSWMQYGGSPYRFRLNVSLGIGQSWTAANHALLLNTVIKAKAVRSRLETITLTRDSPPGPVAVGIGVAVKLTLTVGPQPLTLVQPAAAYVRVAGYVDISLSTRLQ